MVLNIFRNSKKKIVPKINRILTKILNKKNEYIKLYKYSENDIERRYYKTLIDILGVYITILSSLKLYIKNLNLRKDTKKKEEILNSLYKYTKFAKKILRVNRKTIQELDKYKTLYNKKDKVIIENTFFYIDRIIKETEFVYQNYSNEDVEEILTKLYDVLNKELIKLNKIL